ncbi:peptidase M20 [Brevundimonas sp. Leaf363]|uniref:M20/M25/M40 family metallo-hydrolase n=1 Tax=Brevundimonas sp. Leaf363 TaxID=1736353 RepID=UPI0006FC10E6|nr:M20/M25/M40 family metallo-hydrolase [Brevundimonas sp. Leaf363]KQS57520.1 peptidase M20 [Brevundimonas sp. Leaf363]
MTFKPVLLSLAALLAAAPVNAQTIDANRLNESVRILASDEFEGRGPATPGEEKTVQWLSEQFAAMGLEPGGDDRSWIQTVRLSRTRQDGPAVITARAGDWTRTLERGPEVLVSSDRPVSHVTVADAPIVFVGYGADAGEQGWDDFKDVDLTGKIMMVLVNDPDFEAAEGDDAFGRFGGRAMTFYGRWTYKFAEAARQGAAGVLVVHETAGAGYPWSTLENSALAPKLDIVRADPNAERAPFQGWIQRDRAAELLSRAGLDYDTLKQAAKQANFRPVELTGVTLSVDFGQTADQVVSRNVLARITGTERPDETVIYSAHWDAYGIGKPAPDGDAIYNGAVDNATGVAAVVELAHAFAEGPKPKRSVVFAAWTAEEAGLLGATWYAAHPIYPLETTVANINVDSFLPGPTEPEIVVIGYGRNDLDALLAARAEPLGRRLIADPKPEAGGFYRSDHFPLALRGVPTLFPAAGFTGASAASRDYVATRYHQPSDEWTPDWTMEGAAQDIGLIYEVGRELADGTAWPNWKAGDEFRAARDASAEARQ